MKDHNKRLVKISNEVHKKAFEQSLILSKIEGRRVSIGEVLERPLLDERVLRELELGSEKRRRGLK